MNLRRTAAHLLRDAARVLSETAERLDPPEHPRPPTLLGVPTPEQRAASKARHPSAYPDGGIVVNVSPPEPEVRIIPIYRDRRP